MPIPRSSEYRFLLKILTIKFSPDHKWCNHKQNLKLQQVQYHYFEWILLYIVKGLCSLPFKILKKWKAIFIVMKMKVWLVCFRIKGIHFLYLTFSTDKRTLQTRIWWSNRANKDISSGAFYWQLSGCLEKKP